MALQTKLQYTVVNLADGPETLEYFDMFSLEYTGISNVSSCDGDMLFTPSVSDFMEKSRTADVRLMTVFLTTVGILGILGNTVVILVCCKYPIRQSTHYFILAMAISDLFVCVTIIPYRIISYHFLLLEAACKFFEGLTYFSVLFSMFLLAVVAIDRYQAVCRPITYHKLSKATGYMVLAVLITTFGISIYPGLIAGHYIHVVLAMYGNKSEQCFTGICNEDGQDRRFSNKTSVTLYSFFFGVMYISLVLIVCVSYYKVFRSLYARFASSTSSPYRHQKRPLATQCDVSMGAVSMSQSVVVNGGKASTTRAETQVFYGSTARPGDTSRPVRRSSTRVSHRRTAKILLLVTAVFILTWIPFLLMKTHLVPNIVTVRLTFFISNMINPVIYSFTNKQFRDNIANMFRYRSPTEHV